MDRRARRRILTRPRTLAFAAALLAISLGATACGVDTTLDGAKLEQEILDQLLPDYPGAIRSVSCPNTSEPQPGQSVLCLATLGGQVIDINVAIGGTEEALTTSASVDARFVAVNEVAALLGATFGDEIGIVTSVDCGQPIMVLAETESVICSATDPRGETRNFDVTIDDAGLINLNLR